MTTPLQELIERLEQAPHPTRQDFVDCYIAIFGEPSSFDALARFSWFTRFIDVGAWTDAAMMLVPTGWNDRVGLMRTAQDKWVVSVTTERAGGIGNATNPALALATASLRARQST